jgi:hypothetical protein
LGHAKFVHGFMRRMQVMMEVENVFLILTSHQNDSIDMTGAAQASYLPKVWSDLRNKSKNCGKAINQSAAYQLIMAKTGTVRSGDSIVGKKIKIRVDKNSYGPGEREIEFHIIDSHFTDTETCLEPAVVTHEWLAKFLAEKSIAGITVTDKKYSSKQLQVVGCSSEEICRAFKASLSHVEYAAKHLQIYGYDDLIDHLKNEFSSGNVPPPPPEEFKEEVRQQSQESSEEEEPGS